MKVTVCVLLAGLMVVSGCSNSLRDPRWAATLPKADPPPPKPRKNIPVVTPVTDFVANLYWNAEDAFWDVAAVAAVAVFVVGYALASDPVIEGSSRRHHLGDDPHAAHGFSYGCWD